MHRHVLARDACAFGDRRRGHPQTADIVISKRYLKAVMMTVVYFENKFMVTLADAEKEQPLVDTLFPHVSGRRRGFQVRAYDSSIFTKLSLWQSEDPSDRDDSPEPPPEVIPTVDLSGDGYTQTYIVMKPRFLSEGSTRRDVFFRFGSWCYAGQVDLGVDALHLGDVPECLPALQRQQSALSFMCETAAVPVSSQYAPILASYSSALAFFQQEIINSEEKLSEMAELGVTAWIEEDWGAAFFELGTAVGSDFDGVELVAAKTYTRGIVLHSVLFGKSLYAVLADADDDQPLLDVAFPDVTARCRGYQIKMYNTEANHGLAPRRLAVWEGRRKGSAGVGWGAGAAITTASILGQDVTKLKHSPAKAASDSKNAAGDDDGGASGGKAAERDDDDGGGGGGKRAEPAGPSRADIAAEAARKAQEKKMRARAEAEKAERDAAEARAKTEAKKRADAEAAARSGGASDSKSGGGGRGDGAGAGSGARDVEDGKVASPSRPETSSSTSGGVDGSGGGGGSAGGGSSKPKDTSPISYNVRAPHHLKPMGDISSPGAKKLGGLGPLGGGARLGAKKPLGDLGPAPWDASGRPVLGKKPLLK